MIGEPARATGLRTLSTTLADVVTRALQEAGVGLTKTRAILFRVAEAR